MKRLVSKYAVLDKALRKVHDLLPGKFVVSLHTGVSSLVLRSQVVKLASRPATGWHNSCWYLCLLISLR